MNYRFDGAGTVTFVGNYQDNEETSAVDVDGTFEQINSNQEETHHHQMSGELRFASGFSDTIDFVAGVFYLKQAYDLHRVTKVDGTPTALTYSFTGLTCGRTFSFGVEARDAAGNVSSRANGSATTGACADTTPFSASACRLTSLILIPNLVCSWL